MEQEQEVEAIFESLNHSLEKEINLRDEIKLAIKEIEAISRQMLAILQQIHCHVFQAKEICNKAMTLFDPLKDRFSQLRNLIPEGYYYRYNDNWKVVVSQLVFMSSLIHWIQNGELITIQQAQVLLGVASETKEADSVSIINQQKNPWVDIEDYLFGIGNLPSELVFHGHCRFSFVKYKSPFLLNFKSRLCVNSVISGDYIMPLKISKFVNDFFAGYRLLNLKNDGLRKRFDSIKYDLKRIEEVVYNIRIRKLTENNLSNKEVIS